MNCQHSRKEMHRTEALLNGKWVTSTVHYRCAECLAIVGIESYSAAFFSDEVQRRGTEWVAVSSEEGQQ